MQVLAEVFVMSDPVRYLISYYDLDGSICAEAYEGDLQGLSDVVRFIEGQGAYGVLVVSRSTCEPGVFDVGEFDSVYFDGGFRQKSHDQPALHASDGLPLTASDEGDLQSLSDVVRFIEEHGAQRHLVASRSTC